MQASASSSSSSSSSYKNNGRVGAAPVSAIAAALSNPDEYPYPYYFGFQKVRADTYDSISNPEGIIRLGLAENTLSLDWLKDWLMNNSNSPSCSSGNSRKISSRLDSQDQGSNDGLTIIDKLAPYQQFDGLMVFKQAMALLMSEVLGGGMIEFEPSQIVLTCGSNPANVILSNCIADPGDAFLVLAPYYLGFNRDMKIHPTVEIIPVTTHRSDNLLILIEALSKAYDSQETRETGQRGPVCEPI